MPMMRRASSAASAKSRPGSLSAARSRVSASRRACSSSRRRTVSSSRAFSIAIAAGPTMPSTRRQRLLAELVRLAEPHDDEDAEHRARRAHGHDQHGLVGQPPEQRVVEARIALAVCRVDGLPEPAVLVHRLVVRQHGHLAGVQRDVLGGAVAGDREQPAAARRQPPGAAGVGADGPHDLARRAAQDLRQLERRADGLPDGQQCLGVAEALAGLPVEPAEVHGEGGLGGERLERVALAGGELPGRARQHDQRPHRSPVAEDRDREVRDEALAEGPHLAGRAALPDRRRGEPRLAVLDHPADDSPLPVDRSAAPRRPVEIDRVVGREVGDDEDRVTGGRIDDPQARERGVEQTSACPHERLEGALGVDRFRHRATLHGAGGSRRTRCGSLADVRGATERESAVLVCDVGATTACSKKSRLGDPWSHPCRTWVDRSAGQAGQECATVQACDTTRSHGRADGDRTAERRSRGAGRRRARQVLPGRLGARAGRRGAGLRLPPRHWRRPPRPGAPRVAARRVVAGHPVRAEHGRRRGAAVAGRDRRRDPGGADGPGRRAGRRLRLHLRGSRGPDRAGPRRGRAPPRPGRRARPAPPPGPRRAELGRRRPGRGLLRRGPRVPAQRSDSNHALHQV